MGQAPVTSFLEALHQLIQQNHFATGHHKAVHSIQVIFPAPVVFFGTLKQEGMVACLLQLCNDVQQGYLAPLAALQGVAALSAIQSLDCCQNLGRVGRAGKARAGLGREQGREGQHSTAQHSTAQHSTAQPTLHQTRLHSTAQARAAQHDAAYDAKLSDHTRGQAGLAV